jgi:hypothetical protein
VHGVEYVAIALAAIFFVLACAHVLWAFGRGASAGAAIPTRADGTPLFRPGRAATLGIAVLLMTAAIIVLGRAAIISSVAPFILYRIGAWVVGVVLMFRTIGDFRYVGLFTRERASRFAQLDFWVYTPLCAILALGTFFVAAN